MTNKNKTSRLGNDPLSWIGKEKTSTEVKKIVPQKETKIIEELDREERKTFLVKVRLFEKIKDYAYWERMKDKEALDHILSEFFKDKDIKKRPTE